MMSSDQQSSQLHNTYTVNVNEQKTKENEYNTNMSQKTKFQYKKGTEK